MKAWIGGRVVLVDDGVEVDRDKAFDLADEFDGFKDVEGPLVNGVMVFTWEDATDAVSDQDLITRTLLICEDARLKFAATVTDASQTFRDERRTFTRAVEAWSWLGDVRREQEDETGDTENRHDDEAPYSEVVDRLDGRATSAMDSPEFAEGEVRGHIPGGKAHPEIIYAVSAIAETQTEGRST